MVATFPNGRRRPDLVRWTDQVLGRPARRRRDVRASWLPGATDHLLVEAALWSGDRGGRAWERFRRDASTLTTDQERLLPLVARTQGADPATDDPLLARGLELLRLTRARAHWFAHKAGPVLQALTDRGAPPMVMKGLPIALRHYDDPGLRPMSDVDVLVPFASFPAAVEALGRLGYAIPTRLPEQFPVDAHALTLRRDDGIDVDLHWLVHRSLGLPGACTAWGPSFWSAPLCDDEFWGRAEPIEVGGTTCVAPSAADLLVHVIVHGAYVMQSPSLRWATDAAAVIRSPHPVDWDVVVEQSQRRRVTLEMTEALGYLVDELGLPVPAETLARLRDARPTVREEVVHAVRTGPALPIRMRARRFATRWALNTVAEPPGHALAAVPRLAAVLARRDRP